VAHQQHRAGILLQRGLEQFEDSMSRSLVGSSSTRTLAAERTAWRAAGDCVRLRRASSRERRALRRDRKSPDSRSRVVARRQPRPSPTLGTRSRHGLIGVELPAKLVEVGYLQVRPRRTVPESGASVPRISLRSVDCRPRSADETEPVAAHDAQRETLHDGPLPVALRDVLQLRDSFPERSPASSASFTSPSRSRRAAR